MEDSSRLQIFNNQDVGQIRVVSINDEPWFVGKDVADILGYQNGSRDINRHVDNDDKMKEMISDGKQLKETILINESGLYSLILSSKLPTAKKFKHWVTSEVLPTIHKHGAYMTDEALHKAITEPDFLIKLATELKEEQEARQKAEAKIEEDKPKVLFAESVGASPSTCLVGELAKMIRQNGVSIGQNRLFEWLRNNGYLVKSGTSRNMPTQASMESGLFEIQERTLLTSDGPTIVRTTRVTGKGQVYFINKFLNIETA